MTNRILFEATNFKISKPGIDVTTATNINDLIVDGAYSGLGMYSTGTFTLSAGQKSTISYSNPNSLIPFVMIQAIRTSDCCGGGIYSEIVTTSYLEDTVPQSRVYESTSTAGKCFGVDFYVSTANMIVTNPDTVARTFRYAIFYPAQAGTTAASYDMTPDALNWTDFSGSAGGGPIGGNSQTISGVGGPVVLRLRAPGVLASGQSIKVKVGATYVASITAGSSSTTFTIDNGSVISFAYDGSAAINTTFSIDNISTSTNNLDTFNVSVTATPDYYLETDFPNATTTGSSSGGTAFIVVNSSEIMRTINQTVTCTIRASHSMDTSVTELLQIYKNGTFLHQLSSGSVSSIFTVVNGDSVVFSYAAKGNASNTFTLYNESLGLAQDTFSTSITDTSVGADYTPSAVDWPDVDVEAYSGLPCSYTGISVGDQRTLGGFNQTISMRFALSATPSSGVTIYFAKNNSSFVAVLDSSSSTYADFTAVSGDFFDVRASRSTNGTYNATVTITNLSTGTTMDTLSIHLLKSTGPPP